MRLRFDPVPDAAVWPPQPPPTFPSRSDLTKRICFTLGALVVFRLGTFIPVPGIDSATFQRIFLAREGSLLGIFDMFTGGGFERISIFALGIMPYIVAMIVVRLLTAATPPFERVMREGKTGREKIAQYARCGAVLLAALHAYGIVLALERMNGPPGSTLGASDFFLTATTVMMTLVGGSVFLMWLCEQITARGVGDGFALVIVAGFVANLPASLARGLEWGDAGAPSPPMIFVFTCGAILVSAIIVFMERAQRRVVVEYPQHRVADRTFGAGISYIRLKVNMPGVAAPIFASMFLLAPMSVADLWSEHGPEWITRLTSLLGRGQPDHLVVHLALIVFFAIFCTRQAFDPAQTAENLRKLGAFIPGIRPGRPTADFFGSAATRMSVVGTVYVAAVCLLPEFLFSEHAVPLYIGGTSLLIVIVGAMDVLGDVQKRRLT